MSRKQGVKRPSCGQEASHVAEGTHERGTGAAMSAVFYIPASIGAARQQRQVVGAPTHSRLTWPAKSRVTLSGSHTVNTKLPAPPRAAPSSLEIIMCYPE
jgi:hypothetical protein